MSSLERVKVGEVLRLSRTPVELDPLQDYVSIGVRSFGRGIFHYDAVPGDKLGKLRFFAVTPGKLVVSNIKGWEGAVALSGSSDARTIASNRFLIYDSINGRIDNGWARWFFLSDTGNELIQRASPGSADRNRTLAVKRFESLTIPLPPIEEQREGAAYLDAMRDRAVSVERALGHGGVATPTEMLPALVDEIIARSKTSRARLSEMVDLVSDIVHPGGDQSPAVDFVGLQHVESNTGRQLGADGLESLKGRKFRFQPGDVIYGYLRPYLNKVWVADHPGLCSVDQYVLRPRPGIDPALIGHVLRGRAVLDAAIRLTHSLQLPRLRSGLLMSLEVPVVPDDCADAVVATLERVRSAVVEVEARRQRQIQAANALLPASLNHVFGSA